MSLSNAEYPRNLSKERGNQPVRRRMSPVQVVSRMFAPRLWERLAMSKRSILVVWGRVQATRFDGRPTRSHLSHVRWKRVMSKHGRSGGPSRPARARLGRSSSGGRTQLRSRRSVAQGRRSVPITLGSVIAYSVRRRTRWDQRRGDLPSVPPSRTCQWEPPTSRRSPPSTVVLESLPAGRSRAYRLTQCGIQIRPNETSPCGPDRELQGADPGARLRARSVAWTQRRCRPTTLQATAGAVRAGTPWHGTDPRSLAYPRLRLIGP